MDTTQLIDRTKEFAFCNIQQTESLPQMIIASVIGKQLLRSGTSVEANYRSAYRGRSKADFAAKLGTALEEIDECGYRMELLIESGIISEDKLSLLCKEANELTAIFTSSIKTAKGKK